MYPTYLNISKNYKKHYSFGLQCRLPGSIFVCGVKPES